MNIKTNPKNQNRHSGRGNFWKSMRETLRYLDHPFYDGRVDR